MQVITNEYRRVNEDLHLQKPNYGKSGHYYSADVLKLCNKLQTKDVLDYGCGKCTLANTIPFIIKKYDPAIRAFHEEPDPADIVAVTDVLEHIEPDLLDNVLEHIKSKTKIAAYMSVSVIPAQKHLPDGRNAHLTVENGEWWFEKLSKYFTILSYTHVGSNIIVTAKPIGLILDKKDLQ